MRKSRGNLMQGAAQRLRALRKQLNYSPGEMAARMGIQITGYYKNESGENVPAFPALYKLQKEFGISMDWLLFNSGPMYLQEKQTERALEREKKEEKGAREFEELMLEVRELVEHMGQDPVLRHEILLYFHKYKNRTGSQENKEPESVL